MILTCSSFICSAVNLGSETQIGNGKYTDCSIGSDGVLHVVIYDGKSLQYKTRSSGGMWKDYPSPPVGIKKNACDRSYGNSARLFVAKSGTAHFVWVKNGNAFYNNFEGGAWKNSMHLPVTKNKCNMHPKVSGGFGKEVMVHSWNYYGGNTLYRISETNFDTPKIKIVHLNEGAGNRDGSVIGPSAESNLDGKVYWVDGVSRPSICELKKDGKKGPCMSARLKGKAGEGFELFPVGNTVGIALRDYASSINRESINTLARASSGKKVIEGGQGYNNGHHHGSFPRAAYSPKENKVYMMYVSNEKNTHISIIDLKNEKVEQIGDITEKGKLPDFGRGPSGGGLAPHPDGGVHLVYSANGKVYHRIISTQVHSTNLSKAPFSLKNIEALKELNRNALGRTSMMKKGEEKNYE